MHHQNKKFLTVRRKQKNSRIFRSKAYLKPQGCTQNFYYFKIFLALYRLKCSIKHSTIPAYVLGHTWPAIKRLFDNKKKLSLSSDNQSKRLFYQTAVYQTARLSLFSQCFRCHYRLSKSRDTNKKTREM